MMNAIIACAVVNAVAVRSDPQIKAHGGNVAVMLPNNGSTLNIVHGSVSKFDTLDASTAVVTSGNVQTSMDALEVDFVARLEELETTFAVKFAEEKENRNTELARLQEAQAQAAAATEAKIQEAIDAVQFGVVVSPGDDLTAALDGMAAEGGKVFLKRGVHELSQTLVVNKAITFVGEGSATIVTFTGAGAVFKVVGPSADSPLMHVTLRSLQIKCNGGKMTQGVLLENVKAAFVEHLQFDSCATDVFLKDSSQNWIQDNKMSYEASAVKVGGIEEAATSKENVFRRNLFGSGFETNLLEAPEFSFEDGQAFHVQSGCLLEVHLLKEVAVPSVNPFELEYLSRIKKGGLATILDGRYLATVDAVDVNKLPGGATINTTTGILSWRPSQAQGGSEFSVALVATGARDDVSYTTAKFRVIESFNIAQCKPVIDWTEDKFEVDPDAACSATADPQAVTDGQRPSGMTWKDVGGAVPYITIDLEKSSKVKSIAIFQPKNSNNRMKTITIKFSDDGKDFGVVATGSLAVNSPGLLGAVFDVDAEGRYARIEAFDQNGNEAGIGEVEIYEKSVTAGVTDLIASCDRGKTAVDVSWDLPEKYDKVRVLRNPLKKVASLSNFPASPDDGTVVYEGNDSKFVDDAKSLKAGNRYFYSAFTYHSISGWSLVAWSAVDSVVISPVNANLAGYKQVVSNMPSAAGLTDGELDSGLQGTSNNEVGDKLTATIDLKETQTFAEVHIYQHHSTNYHLLLADVSISDDGVTWKTLGKLKMDLSNPNRLGAVLTKDASARYVKFEGHETAAHYWGVAEVEIYADKKPKSPVLKAVASGNTAVQLSWTNPDSLDIVVVRQTLVEPGSMSNFPAGHGYGSAVYSGTGSVFLDSDLPTEVQQFYSAFAFHKQTGWSILNWDAVDTALPGDPNPNVALEKKTTSSIDYNSHGASHKVVDGSRSHGDLYTTNGGKVDDYVWVIIDLKYSQDIRNVVIWQSFNNHFMMQSGKVKVSSDGENWKSIGSTSMYISHAGALGAAIDCDDCVGRYVRVEVSGQAGYYYGIGEIEVFGKKRHTAPVLHASTIMNSANIKVDYNAPGSNKVLVVRKKFKKDTNVKQRFPHSRFDGQVVLETTQTSGTFLDKDVVRGARYHYAAYARSASLGWSMINYNAVDSTVSGAVNPNLAMDKRVVARHNHQVTYGTADQVNDGDRARPYAMTDRVSSDGLKVDIDLKKVRNIREILIWLPGSSHFIMNRWTIYFTRHPDGENWSLYKENVKATLSQPGGKGIEFNCNFNARWIRIRAKANAGYYYGIGEVEVYEKPTTASPTNLVAQYVDGGGTRLTWSAPTGQRTVLRRKKFTSPGDLYKWPLNEDDGVLLLDTKTEKSFVDKTAGLGKQWFYGLYTYNTNTGWSLISKPALDSWCAGCSNPNVALFKPLSGSTVDATIIYGLAHYANDGSRSAGPCTTDGEKLKKYGGKVGFVVDLKSVRKIRQIVAWQPGGFNHFGMNYCEVWGGVNNNNNWQSYGKSEMYKDYPGGLGYIWNLDVTVRYLRLSCSDQTGYYYGFGELEAYEVQKHGNPMMRAEVGNKDTESKISWTVPGGTEEVVIRRTAVSEAANRDSYPAAHDLGTEVYRGTGSSFTDVDLTAKTWYYYSAYAYSKSKGWSLVHTDACDAVQAGESTQNWARGAWAESNMGRSMVYGTPYQIGDGNTNNGPATTGRINFGWRPNDSKIWVKLDLGQQRSFSKFVTRTKSFHFQSSKVRMYVSNNIGDYLSTGSSSWVYVGSWNDLPYGNGVNPSNSVSSRTFSRRTARYVYLAFTQAPGNYYYGTGEFELF